MLQYLLNTLRASVRYIRTYISA